MICVLGGGATLLALQATIGLLVAKTLSTATVNPFMASGSQTWNPVLAFDVFNVQASARQGSWNTSGASIRPLLSRVGARTLGVFQRRGRAHRPTCPTTSLARAVSCPRDPLLGFLARPVTSGTL